MKTYHQRTKCAIADALKQLMEKNPLEDISVGRIIAAAQVSRNTFYYHFKDKYDLVNWIFTTETEPFTSRPVSRDNWQTRLYDICRYLKENQTFYTNALRLTGQNSLQEYLTGYFTHLLKARLSLLCEQKGHAISQTDADFAARFYSYAIVGMITHWASDGMREDFTLCRDSLAAVLSGSYLEELPEEE